MLHEVGHLLGLNHIPISSNVSVMNPTISAGSKVRTLYDIDIANIKLNYTSSSSLNFAISGDNIERQNDEGDFVTGYRIISG